MRLHQDTDRTQSWRDQRVRARPNGYQRVALGPTVVAARVSGIRRASRTTVATASGVAGLWIVIGISLLSGHALDAPGIDSKGRRKAAGSHSGLACTPAVRTVALRCDSRRLLRQDRPVAFTHFSTRLRCGRRRVVLKYRCRRRPLANRSGGEVVGSTLCVLSGAEPRPGAAAVYRQTGGPDARARRPDCGVQSAAGTMLPDGPVPTATGELTVARCPWP